MLLISINFIFCSGGAGIWDNSITLTKRIEMLLAATLFKIESVRKPSRWIDLHQQKREDNMKDVSSKKMKPQMKHQPLKQKLFTLETASPALELPSRSDFTSILSCKMRWHLPIGLKPTPWGLDVWLLSLDPKKKHTQNTKPFQEVLGKNIGDLIPTPRISSACSGFGVDGRTQLSQTSSSRLEALKIGVLHKGGRPYQL